MNFFAHSLMLFSILFVSLQTAGMENNNSNTVPMIERRFIVLNDIEPRFIPANSIALKNHLALCRQLQIDARNQCYSTIAWSMNKKIGQITNFLKRQHLYY